jgi:hypothetical protein
MKTLLRYASQARRLHFAGLAAAVFSVLMLASCSSTPKPPGMGYVPRVVPHIDPEVMAHIEYQKDVQPLFDRRCVVCHSCFDAPAQLKLNCSDGVVRGATKQRVYDSTRLKQAKHTRLHIDAQTEEEWRAKGFFSVLPDPAATNIQERLDTSVLYQMLALSRVRQLPEKGLLDGIVRSNHDVAEAPTIDEFDLYATQFPCAGMPFYTYGLTENEFSTFMHWTAKGAPVEKEAVILTDWEQERIDKWETLLNGDSLRDQLIARYLYEHWSYANLHFSDAPQPVFYKVVRSRTPRGKPIERIATACCTDDPDVARVYYRIKKRHGALMRKTHLPYALNDAKLKRLQALFWEAKWDITELPPYGGRWKERPFEVFSSIPERSRYQFLLDDSYFFIQGFIRGPVCRGQIALNGIQDHFSVIFMDPDVDPSCADPEFRNASRDYLVLPTRINTLFKYVFGFPKAKSRFKKFQKEQEKAIDRLFPAGSEIGMDAIWDGKGTTGTPLLTIFRHFDTASVVEGLVGPTPTSAWFGGYALFERIHYLLVANYDVYGPVAHGMSTRLYFDLLRYEGESNFMRLLPPEKRHELFKGLYQGISSRELRKKYKLPNDERGVDIAYTRDKDPMDQLHRMLKKRDDQVREERGDAYSELRHMSRTIPQSMADFVQYTPEVLFIRVKMNDGTDEVYTILRNKAQKHVAHMFGEAGRRDPRNDNLVLLPGLIGDYPNFLMVIDEDDLDNFKESFFKANSVDKVLECYMTYAIMRNSTEFWPALDWFVEWQQKDDPINAGLFDLKHYFLTRLLSLPDADLVTVK